MSRKLTSFLIGSVCLFFVLAFSNSASAAFTQDTMVLYGQSDTSSAAGQEVGADTVKIDIANDSSGNIYVLHAHQEGTDSRLLITKFDKYGTFLKVITVGRDSLPVRARKISLAVNYTSGAVYVAVAGESGAFLYTDAAPADDSFDTVGIPYFRLVNMSDTFGFIDVSVFGGSSTDSVFVVAAVDTPFLSNGTGRDSPGIKLWVFNPSGSLADSAILYSRADSRMQPVENLSEDTTSALTISNIAYNAKIQALSANSFGILLFGVLPTFPGDTPRIANATYPDTRCDTGLGYDTFQVLGKGRIESDLGIDTIITYETAAVAGALNPTPYSAFRKDTFVIADMIYDRTNSQIVIYYKSRKNGAKLRRATISGGNSYSPGADSDVGGDLNVLTTADSALADIAVAIDGGGYEHVAMRTTSNRIYYVKRNPGTQATNLVLDTVATPTDNASDTLNQLAIATTSGGEARVFYARPNTGQWYINIGKPASGVAVASGAGVQVVSSQVTTTTTAPTLTSAPPVSDTNQLTQISCAVPSATTVASGSLSSSFTSPTYTITAPLGNRFGDTLEIRVNSTSPGVAMYIRRIEDTTTSGGNNSWDTDVFGGIPDTQMSILMEAAVVLRAGDTAGVVYAEDRSFSDTLAVELRFTYTKAMLNRMNGTGIDTRNLTCWTAKLNDDGKLTTTNDFSQLGHVSNTVDHTANSLTVRCNPLTHFSAVVNAPGITSSSSDNGICVVTQYVSSMCPLCATLRQMRDAMLSSKMGRVFTSIYYNLK